MPRSAKKVNIIASGRTDSGVHAAGQVCHFSADISVPAEKIADALNFRLPPDICVLKSVTAPEEFDSNRSAKKKTYCYRMYAARREHPLKSRYAVAVYPRPNVELMQKGAQLYCGEHDFKAYCASGSSVKTTVRNVFSVEVQSSLSRGCEDILLTVCGGGFFIQHGAHDGGNSPLSRAGQADPFRHRAFARCGRPFARRQNNAGKGAYPRKRRLRLRPFRLSAPHSGHLKF